MDNILHMLMAFRVIGDETTEKYLKALREMPKENPMARALFYFPPQWDDPSVSIV